jgi:hypothetical protein
MILNNNVLYYIIIIPKLGSHTQVVNDLILFGRVGELKELTIVTRFPQSLDAADNSQVMALFSIGAAWITAVTVQFQAVRTDKSGVSVTNGIQVSCQIVAIQQDEFFQTKTRG